jgi:hypothetical protein
MTLGLLSAIPIPYRSFFSKKPRGLSQFFYLVRPARLTVKAVQLLCNNVEATSFAALLGSRLTVLEYNLVIEENYLKVRVSNERYHPHYF